MNIERRAFPLTEIRMIDEENSPKITGYAAVFNELSENLGGFREQIAPGAFAKTIQTADVRALWNHDPNFVLGRNKSGTLQLAEDERGLRIEIIPPDAQWAKDLIASMKRGDVDQMSFGFRTIEDEWETRGGENIRTLKEVELFDVSIVTYPAYPQTEAQARLWDYGKTLDMDEWNRLIIRLRHGLPLTDEDKRAIRSWRDYLERHLSEEFRAASGATDLPLADRERPWDSDAAVARVREWAGGPDKESINWSRYRRAFFWYDENDPENFGSYKLPFADVIDGELKAVPRAIFAAAAAIQGARGGVDIPSEDLPAVRRKIAAYYRKLDEVPPWEESQRNTAKVEQEPSLANEANQTPQVRNMATLRRKLELLKRKH
jgi:uncharacterized protein